MHNPILQDISAMLQASPAGLTEFAIHRELAGHEAFRELGETGSLALFRKHFLVMNALYQLKQQLWDEQRLLLEISPLHIQLTDYDQEAKDGTELGQHHSLADHYLDWNHFENASEASVDKLLDGFWRRYMNLDARGAALDTLQLDAGATADEIQRSYRELAAKHHPDRGGSEDAFIRIREAWEILR